MRKSRYRVTFHKDEAGKRYAKFYVPVETLRPIEEAKAALRGQIRVEGRGKELMTERCWAERYGEQAESRP